MKRKTKWLLCVLAILILCLFVSCKKKEVEKPDDNSEIKQEKTELPSNDLDEEEISTEESSSNTTNGEQQSGDGNTDSTTQSKDDGTSNETREPILLPEIKVP